MKNILRSCKKTHCRDTLITQKSCKNMEIFLRTFLPPWVRAYVQNHQISSGLRLVKTTNNSVRSTNEPLFAKLDGPEDILKVGLWYEVPLSSGNSHALTTCDTFSIYLFVVRLGRPDTTPLVHSQSQIFTEHVYVHKQSLIDKRLYLIELEWRG